MEANMHYIYRITNTINNKVYIGQTYKPKQRWSQHKSDAKYKRGVLIITKSIAKRGPDAFLFEVIASCRTQEDVDVIEEIVIRQYDARNPDKGYNVAVGGKVRSHTPEICAKISAGLKEHYETHDSKLLGVKFSEERKAALSEAMMGKPGTNNGKIFDDEWRVKISKARAGKEQKSKRRFSEEAEREICRLYVEEEKSTYALGKELECQRTTIADILKRSGIEIRQSNYTGHSNGRNIFTEGQEKEICDLYMTGTVSRTELARKYNCGKTTIRDILLRHNIKL